MIVKRSLVLDSNETGEMSTVYLLDRTALRLPEARVYVDCPFFTGYVTATCMDDPLYEVILGNIDGVPDAAATDANWSEQQRVTIFPKGCPSPKRKLKTDKTTDSSRKSNQAASPLPDEGVKEECVGTAKRGAQLPVATIGPFNVSPAELASVQKEDSTLQSCFESVGRNTTMKTAQSVFVLVHEILFSRYRLSSKKEMEQLVVPTILRDFVLKMAHEGILSGHQGIKRTMDRVLEEFYWPGVQSDITCFVKSCDICQRTVPKHLVGRVPLGCMPVIETPFQRVAIDFIGPLSPTHPEGEPVCPYHGRFRDTLPRRGGAAEYRDGESGRRTT